MLAGGHMALGDAIAAFINILIGVCAGILEYFAVSLIISFGVPFIIPGLMLGALYKVLIAIFFAMLIWGSIGSRFGWLYFIPILVGILLAWRLNL